jgi:hypothetical protein
MATRLLLLIQSMRLQRCPKATKSRHFTRSDGKFFYPCRSNVVCVFTMWPRTSRCRCLWRLVVFPVPLTTDTEAWQWPYFMDHSPSLGFVPTKRSNWYWWRLSVCMRLSGLSNLGDRHSFFVLLTFVTFPNDPYSLATSLRFRRSKFCIFFPSTKHIALHWYCWLYQQEWRWKMGELVPAVISVWLESSADWCCVPFDNGKSSCVSKIWLSWCVAFAIQAVIGDFFRPIDPWHIVALGADDRRYFGRLDELYSAKNG